MSLAALTAALALAAAPLAEVWPYAVKRQPDGTLEYSYDLGVVKAAGGNPDARELHGEEKLKAFLSGLPRSVTLRVAPGASLEVTTGRPPEGGRLATSFASVSDAPVATGDALGNRGAARLRAPLDPDEPKLLASADVLAWQVRRLEQGALAALEQDTEALRRELWSAVQARALERLKASDGDAKEGALALAARVAAGAACLDAARVPAALRANAELSAAIDAELQRYDSQVDWRAVPAPWSWRAELTCAWLRAHVMAEPFPQSRAGAAAVLLYLELLAKEPKLAALLARIEQRHRAFFGESDGQALAAWRAQAKPEESVDALGAFLDSLPLDARVPPGLLPMPVSPFGSFLRELKGAERQGAFAELAAATQDGRLAFGGEGWVPAREAALAQLTRGEGAPLVRLDGDWRDRLRATFEALVGAHGEAGGGQGAPARGEEGERTELKVALKVPPHLEVEPVALVFARQATSLRALAAALQAEKLGRLSGVGPNGEADGPVLPAARALATKLEGLAALADPARASSPEAAAGRKALASWRSEPRLGEDVREASAAPVSIPAERGHAAIVGVGRRELAVSFGKVPTIRSLTPDAMAGLEAVPAEQRYLVPVLVTVGSSAPPAAKALDRRALRALVDAHGRDAVQVEGAFTEALRR